MHRLNVVTSAGQEGLMSTVLHTLLFGFKAVLLRHEPGLAAAPAGSPVGAWSEV